MNKASALHPQAWQNAKQALRRSNQAVLLCGRQGLGKTGVAMALAAWLLCENNVARDLETACGDCVGCRLVASGQHPDWQWVTLPRKFRDIQVWAGEAVALPKSLDRDQIRMESLQNQQEFMNLSATRGGARVLMINPLDAMNRNTSNALLKILEEPSPGLHFILVADQMDRIPATIKSRCRIIPLPAPLPLLSMEWLSESMTENTKDECRQALAMAGDAPVLARFWLTQSEWLAQWQESLRETQGLAMMDWAETLAIPVKKGMVSKKAVSAKNKAVKKNSKKVEVEAEPLNDGEEDDSTLAAIGLDTALEIFQRNVIDRLWRQFNLQPPFQAMMKEEDGLSNNANRLPLAQLHKLFHLYDEILFFRRMATFTPNATQVLERLLLQWMQIRPVSGNRH